MYSQQPTWIKLTTFSVLAILLSAPFHLNWFDFGNPVEQSWLKNISFLLHGIGPLISALICFTVFRKSHDKHISMSGGKPWLQVILLFIGIILGTSIGLNVPFIDNRSLSGLYAVLFTLVYAFSEETGWRGFLQDVLRKWPVPAKYVTIGGIWYLWHLSFLRDTTFTNELIFLLILLISAWALGQAVEHTKSVLIATYLHFVINFLWLNDLFRSDFQSKVIIVAPFTAVVILIIVYWPKLEFNIRK